MQSPRYRALLRLIFGAVMKADLDATQMKALAVELRRGNLSDELAYMLEEISRHFREDERIIDDRVRLLDEAVKQRRISKSRLLNIMASLNANYHVSSSLTVRQILEEFISVSSSRQIEKLFETLISSGGDDPFLKGISERNS